MAIHVQNLLKTYGAQHAVNNLSFSVERGEIVGFLGPNGAGKSTTMKMITGFLKPDAGAISVNGIDVITHPLDAKKIIGYLPESNALYYDMYVREYLSFIADVHALNQRKTAIEKSIATVGLLPESNKKIGQLSKGYKQRVGLAAALLHNPDVLILDEPTSGLDPNQIVEIRNVIKEEGRKKLVLFSSHILSEVEAICDRVIIINKGTIVANDTLQNLRQQNNTPTVKVRFTEPLEPEWLRRLPGVTSVVKEGATGWALQTADTETVRKAILELAVQENLNIELLQNESNSLETIFRNLTQTTPV